MKIPRIIQLPSGNYFCRLRLNGQSIPITEASYDLCEAKARAIKAGAMEIKKLPPSAKTLRVAIDEYINDRYHVLSPSTIRGYRTIQRNRLRSVMDKPIGNVRSWQKAVDDDARVYSPKTVANTWGLVRTVLGEYMAPPKVKLPQKIKSVPKYLRPEEIPLFVKEISKTKYAVPALLALSSMRLSEIKALKWENIPEDPAFIRVAGSVVPGEHNVQCERKQNKTVNSARNVPVLIPELTEALKRERGTGSLMPCHETLLRKMINRTCRKIGAEEVGIHGLRHSFASLAYHVGMPVKIAMEIGGWANESTIMKIYTHIAESDISRYQSEMRDFYAR